MDAKQVTTAVCEMLRAHGGTPILEYTLPNRRRLDIACIGGHGRLLGVEVKVSAADFNRDLKWAEVMSQCFIFYFAVPDGFPIDLIHPGIRVIVVQDGIAHPHRRMGRGLTAPHKWHEATGRYAVNPTAGVDPAIEGSRGDSARGRLWLP